MFLSDVAFETMVRSHAREVESLKEEIAWLREQVGQQYAQQRTIERKKENLPINPKRDQPLEDIPPDILELVAFFPARAQEELQHDIRLARSGKESWETIKRGIRATLPPSLPEKPA